MRIVKARQFIKRHPRIYDAFNTFRTTHGQLGAWLNAFSETHSQGVNFLQVGASDGLRWDPFRKHILKGRWNGILIEPLVPVFEMLKRNYSHARRQNLVFVNAAITSASVEEFQFWSYSEEFLSTLSVDQQLFWLRTSSSDKAQVLRRLVKAKHDDAEKKIAAYAVPGMPIRDVLAQRWQGGPMDLVLIDAEGHDDEVVYGMDLSAHRPKAILFESHNLPEERKAPLIEHLKSFSYSVSRLDGDTVADLMPAH